MRTRDSSRQRELWSKAPKGWANIQEPTHEPLWEAMLDAAFVGEGTRVLDAGCGSGGASLSAAARGADIAGLDAAEGLVTIARRRVPAGDFRVGDLEHLPFNDDEHDAVIAANSVQYAADRVAALGELRRVCVAGVHVVVALFGPPEKVAFAVVFQALGAAMTDRASRCWKSPGPRQPRRSAHPGRQRAWAPHQWRPPARLRWRRPPR